MGEFVYKRQEQLGVKLETREEFGSEIEVEHLRGWDIEGDGRPEGMDRMGHPRGWNT